MEGVSIVSTELLQTIINKIEDLHKQVNQMNEERNAGLAIWMTTKQVASYLHVTPNWVLLRKHELGSSKRAGNLLFKRLAVDEYIAEDWFRMGEELKTVKQITRPAKRKL
jgi:hypothetical protein